jgi:hypothetical protein
MRLRANGYPDCMICAVRPGTGFRCQREVIDAETRGHGDAEI